MSLNELPPEGFEDEKEETYIEPTEDDLAKIDKVLAKKKKMWWIVTIYSLIGITLFAVIGYLLDRWLDTEPILLLSLAIGSFPFVQFALYKRGKKLTKE